MGRPKKGELMRKPLKKLGVKPQSKGYDRPPMMAASNRSSMSSEYEQEDVSNPDDVFDHVTPQHHGLAAGGHQQIPTHVQHQLQQQQQQQQQQQAGFSLGSILHDCMTVQDWSQNGEMSEMDTVHPPGQRSVAGHPVVMASSTGSSVSAGSLSEELKSDPSPHLRHTSPTLHPNVLGLQQQQIQFQNQQQQQQQQLQVMNHYQGDLSDQSQQQQPTRQMTPFQSTPVTVTSRDIKISASNNNMDIISGLDFPDDHDLPVNRPIKVETMTLADGSAGQVAASFDDGNVVLEDMQNLQTLGKAEFHNFNMSSANDAYSLTDQQRSASVPAPLSATVPISQLEPSVSSQIVAINMTSESIVYTPQPHEQIIVQNGIPHLIQHQGEHSNSSTTQAEPLDESQIVQQQQQGQDGVVITQQGHDLHPRSLNLDHEPQSLDGSHTPVIVSHGSALRPEHLPHHVTSVAHSQENSSVLSSGSFFGEGGNHILQQQQQQHYGTDASIVVSPTSSPLTTTRAGSTGPNTPHSVISDSSHYQNHQQTITSNPPHSLATPSPIPSSSHNTGQQHNQPQTPNRRSSILAILQQHRDAIQAGRTVQLSPEEIGELLSTVNADKALAQRHLNPSSSSALSGISNKSQLQRSVVSSAEQNIVDLRRQQKMFQTNSDSDDGQGFMSRQTPPGVVPGAGTSVQQQRQFQSTSPVVAQSTGVRPLSRQLYSTQSSPASESSMELRLPQRPHSTAGIHNIAMSDAVLDAANLLNNNNNNNSTNSRNNSSNMNINAIQRRLYSPSPGQIPQQAATRPQTTSVAAPAAQQSEALLDDSFNSSLIRDSTLLHEINRIFLGIDNSCDAYGCRHRGGGEGDGNEGQADRIDDHTVLTSMSPDSFNPEVSHRYWHGFRPSRGFAVMTPERQKVILDVLEAFDNLQRTYVTNEPEYSTKKSQPDQLEHWHHIQRRIARHVVAGQRFCRNIPGYFKLDIQDRICLGKHVGFGLMVLIACTEFYDPEFKRFKYIWNWTMPMQNPLFSYKVHLLSLGDRIHDIMVDRTEAAMLCAISMTSIDCPGLIKPGIVCVVRDALIDALEAHISAQTDETNRLTKLLSLMPQVRLMTLWYNNLMKKMSLPSEMVNNKLTKPRQREPVGSENTLNVS